MPKRRRLETKVATSLSMTVSASSGRLLGTRMRAGSHQWLFPGAFTARRLTHTFALLGRSWSSKWLLVLMSANGEGGVAELRAIANAKIQWLSKRPASAK